MSDSEQLFQEIVDAKKIYWNHYQRERTINSGSINDGKVAIAGVGSVKSLQCIFYDYRQEALLFNGVFGKVTDNQVVCRSHDGRKGQLKVDPSEIPNGYQISINGDCKNCFMGTVQRFHLDGWNQKLPSCSAYTFAKGYYENDNGNIDIVIVRLTSLLSKPLNRLRSRLRPGDEVIVSFAGDSNSKTAKFEFEIAEQKVLEPHNRLQGLFNKHINSEFEKFWQGIKATRDYMESISPENEGGFLSLPLASSQNLLIRDDEFDKF